MNAAARVLAATLCWLPAGATAEFTHVFFLDASGSMQKVLGPPGSAARTRLAAPLFGAPADLKAGSVKAVFKFTESPAPVANLSGAWDSSRLANYLLQGLELTRRNTDLIRVFEEAVGLSVGGGVTLAWILTDNVNDPRGSGPDVANTRAFYERLFDQSSPVRRVYFFPFRDLGAVLYLVVLASPQAVEGIDIDRFENALNAYSRTLKAPRIRAKPVGGDTPLEIDPRVGVEGPNQQLSIEMIGQGSRGVLRIRGLREGEPLRGAFRVRLRSRFEEWRIVSARIRETSLRDLTSKEFPNLAEHVSSRLTPSAVSVDPRSTSAVRYALELGAGGDAPVPQAPFFTWAAWNPDGFGTVRGRLVLRIGDVDLRLQIFNDPTATEAIKNVFSLHDIEYFVPKKFHERELRLDFAVPVEFEVEYRHWPRWLATVVSLLAVVALLLFLFAGGARVRYLRLVGYSEEPLRLAPGKPQAFAPGGRPVAEFRLTRRGAIVCRPIGDAKVNGSVKQTTVLPGSMVVIVSEGLEYSYRADVVQAPAAAPPRPGAGSGMY